MAEEIAFYAVRNQAGKYFRAKGYCGSRKSWVDDLQNARIYARLGPAKAICSYCVSAFPNFGTPVVVKLVVGTVEVLDQTERIKKQLEKDKKAKIKADIRRKENEVAAAEEELLIARKKLDALKGKA